MHAQSNCYQFIDFLIKFLKLPIHGTLIEVFINIILVWITVLKSLDTEQTDSPWEVSSLSWEILDFFWISSQLIYDYKSNADSFFSDL